MLQLVLNSLRLGLRPSAIVEILLGAYFVDDAKSTLLYSNDAKTKRYKFKD